MGDFIYNWLKQIVTIFIILSISELIITNGNMKKYINFIMGMLVIFTFIDPFVKLGNLNLDLNKEIFNYDSIEMDFRNYDEMDLKRDELVEKIYLERISQEVIGIIEKTGEYTVEKVTPYIIKEEESYGSIEYLDIIISHNREEIKNKIRIESIDIEKGINKREISNTQEYKDISKILADKLDIEEDCVNILLKDEEHK